MTMERLIEFFALDEADGKKGVFSRPAPRPPEQATQAAVAAADDAKKAVDDRKKGLDIKIKHFKLKLDAAQHLLGQGKFDECVGALEQLSQHMDATVAAERRKFKSESLARLYGLTEAGNVIDFGSAVRARQQRGGAQQSQLARRLDPKSTGKELGSRVQLFKKTLMKIEQGLGQGGDPARVVEELEELGIEMQGVAKKIKSDSGVE